ncbi:unnamed protein product, partial [Meganyctiphanes norvegica]
AIECLRQYGDEVTGLRSWLSEVETFIKAEEAALGDLETLEAQLEQSNALQDDILTLQSNFTNVSTTAQKLIKEGDEDLKKEVEDQLKELESRWKTVTEQAKIQNKSLKDALSRSQKVTVDIQKFNTWLDEVEKKIPSNAPIETSGDLSNTINVFNNLRSEINDHSETFKILNETGDEMLQAENPATHDDLAKQFTQLNGRWTEVVSQIDSRYKTLTTAQEQYDEFKKLCTEETSWLDQLEQKLEKSSKSAADAEEISEALDELEIFLHSHSEDRLDSVRSLAENLVREGVMTVAVQNSTHTLTSRFNNLSSQASEQQQRLEGGVQEAQAWEREYVSVLDYLQHTDMMLTQAFTDPTVQIEALQVQGELLIQQEMLKKMTDQVELYRNQGKTEAALRLQDQISHLNKKCEEVESKLKSLGKPSDFEERFNQVSNRLQDVSQSVNQVTLKSGVPEEIQEQLNHCLELYQVLSSVKGEVESVIATGRKIVKDGQSTNPDELTKQLDDLKALYNQLGGAVTDQRGSLERSIRNARKIQKDSSQLEDWLSTTEGELDRREATVPAKSLQHEIDFAQHAIDDIGRKKPLLTGLHESYSALTSESTQPQLLCKVKDQVDDIALTWERVNTRLVNRLKNVKVELEAKEGEMENFIMGLGDIKAWLESTENTLSNLCDQDLDQQEKTIKKLSGEVQDYKSQIEHIRDTAVDLIAHGTLFQDRIQPELVNINQRWEIISRTVQHWPKEYLDDLPSDATSISSTSPNLDTKILLNIPSNTTTSNTPSNTATITTDTPNITETNDYQNLTSVSTQNEQEILKSNKSSEENFKSPDVEGDVLTIGDTTDKRHVIRLSEEFEIIKNDDDCGTISIEEQTTITTSGLERSMMSSTTTISSCNSQILVTEVMKVESTPEKENSGNDNGNNIESISDEKHISEEKDKVDDREIKLDILESEENAVTSEQLQILDSPKQDKKINIVEVEEVKTTISHLSFNFENSNAEKTTKLTKESLETHNAEIYSRSSDSSISSSPTSEVPPRRKSSSSESKDRKRKITESEQEPEPENLDALIAGLKASAEKPIDPALIEKARRKNSARSIGESELEQTGEEKFSLLKIRRTDDDDLESLASIDTDMAPASETSRDFEGTFSDLESVSESVSSRGDSLFSPSGPYGTSLSEYSSYGTILESNKIEELRTKEKTNIQIALSENVSHASLQTAQAPESPAISEASFKLLEEGSTMVIDESDEKNDQTVKTEKNICSEKLPVEKLQAMIAELEVVMPESDMSDSDENEKCDTKFKKDEMIKMDIDETQLTETNLNNQDKECSVKDKDVMISTNETNAVEFKVQEIHVDGEIEIGKAYGSVEDYVSKPLQTPSEIKVISPQVQADIIGQPSWAKKSGHHSSTNKSSKFTSEEFVKTTQKIVTVQSSEVVHGMTLISSSEDRLPEAEQATLVTLISHSGSAETISSEALTNREEEEEPDMVDVESQISLSNITNSVSEQAAKKAPRSDVSVHEKTSVDDKSYQKVRRTTDTESSYSTNTENSQMEEIDKKESASISHSVKTSSSHMHSAVQETSTSKSANDDEVESYLREVTEAVDQISSIRDRVAAIPSYDDPVKQTEAIEQEVALMEPDVATVISRGDTLTLTTHMVDVPRANTIRIAVNDLRKHWTELKTTTEDIKSETEQVNTEMKKVTSQVDEIVIWITEVTKRLHLVNNDESQLEVIFVYYLEMCFISN